MNRLKGMLCALKRDGIYLMADISGTSHVHKDRDHPIDTFLCTISSMHCMTVSLAQGGEGLGAMWGAEDPQLSATRRLYVSGHAQADA